MIVDLFILLFKAPILLLLTLIEIKLSRQENMSSFITRRFLANETIHARDFLQRKNNHHCRHLSDKGQKMPKSLKCTKSTTISTSSHEAQSKSKFKVGTKTYFLIETSKLSLDHSSPSKPHSFRSKPYAELSTQGSVDGSISKGRKREKPSKQLLLQNAQKEQNKKSKCDVAGGDTNLPGQMSVEVLKQVSKQISSDSGMDANSRFVTNQRSNNVETSNFVEASKIQSDNDFKSILKYPFFGEKFGSMNEVPGNKLKIVPVWDSSIPSVSLVLRSTMSPEAAANLARWEELMIAKLGEDGFSRYKESLLQNGKDFHSLLERILLGNRNNEEFSMSPTLKSCYQSIKDVVCNIFEVYAVESQVVHPDLSYKGFVDCIVNYKGQTVMIEWKHSEKKKNSILSTYDNPIQLMAYMGALNADKKYPFQVKSCLLAIAYTDGSPADVYSLSSEEQAKYWQMWLHRLNLFKEQETRTPEINAVNSDNSTIKMPNIPLKGAQKLTSSSEPSQTKLITQQDLKHKETEQSSKCSGKQVHEIARSDTKTELFTPKETLVEANAEINVSKLSAYQYSSQLSSMPESTKQEQSSEITPPQVFKHKGTVQGSNDCDEQVHEEIVKSSMKKNFLRSKKTLEEARAESHDSKFSAHQNSSECNSIQKSKPQEFPCEKDKQENKGLLQKLWKIWKS